jgi:hypothetical protein
MQTNGFHQAGERLGGKLAGGRKRHVNLMSCGKDENPRYFG